MIQPVLPDRFRCSIQRWLEHAISPGSFLMAVLENDLRGAMANADNMSIKQLPGIVCWLHGYAPMGSWGSRETVSRWLDTIKSASDSALHDHRETIRVLMERAP